MNKCLFRNDEHTQRILILTENEVAMIDVEVEDEFENSGVK